MDGLTMTEKYLKQLKILSIIYYVLAALGALSSVAIAGLMMLGLSSTMGFTTSILIAGGVGFLTLGFVYLFHFAMAQNLSKQKHPLYCMVIAGISCLSFPLGTILGVWTLVLLNKPEVKALFTNPKNSFSEAGLAMNSSVNGTYTYHSDEVEVEKAETLSHIEMSTLDNAEDELPPVDNSDLEMIPPSEKPVIQTEYIAPPAPKAPPSKTNNAKQVSGMFSNDNNPWLKHSQENK